MNWAYFAQAMAWFLFGGCAGYILSDIRNAIADSREVHHDDE